jgi:hypothetical protein
MRGGANLSEALRRVGARPWLLAALALINVGITVLLSAPLSAALANLIDLRPAAGAMAGGDDGLLFELFTDHAAIAIIGSVALGGGVLVYGLLSWILDGGVLAALALDDDRGAIGGAQIVAESARRAGRMVKIGLLGTLLRVIPALFAALAYFIAHAVVTGRTFQPNLRTAMLSLVIGAVAWTAMSIAIDYARGLALHDARTSSWRLVGRGFLLVFLRPSETLQLVAFSMAAWVGIGFLYYVLASHLTALPLLTLLRVIALVARVAVTATTLTAAARIARSS